MSFYTLHLGDCLDYMRGMNAGSVDAIITDLPYGTTACPWDEVISFGPMWEQVKRVLKPTGAFVTTASQPFTSLLISSNLKMFRYCWVWEKTLATGYLNANRAPMKAHEDVVVFSLNGHKYNPQKSKNKPYRATRGAVGGIIRDKSVGGYVTENSGDRFPRSVIQFNSADNPVHPTQKPTALYEYLIKTYTDEGDTVLDFVMGSGTTGEACMNTGRNFIGVEKFPLNDRPIDETMNPNYFYPAERRIKDAAAQLRLFDDEKPVELVVYRQTVAPL